MCVIKNIENVVIEMIGEDVIPVTDAINTAIESTVYSLAGFIENYPATIAQIYALNPNAEIIILGINNFLDGFYIPIDDEYEIDLGFFGCIAANAMNSALQLMVPEAPNIHYVDIVDVESKAAYLDGFDLKDAIDAYESPADILEILDLCAPSELGQQQIVDAIENIFLDKTYTTTYNVKIGDDVTTETFELNYGSDIPVYTPGLPAGYRFTGWDYDVPETMPAKDLVFNTIPAVTDSKIIIEIDDSGNIVTTIVGLDGSYAVGTLKVNYVYGYVEDGIFETGTEFGTDQGIGNDDAATFVKITTDITSGETRTIQSAWAVYTFADGQYIETPHILYNYVEAEGSA